MLSLFPLPNVVLFPGIVLPLHIFEPRYRALVGDALEGDRRIGMVLLRPGWEAGYEGRPAVFPVGCSGAIVHAERLEDGRYNIVLRGQERFRIVEEDHARSYRRATVELVPDAPLEDEDRYALSHLRAALESLLTALMDRGGNLSVSYATPMSAMTDLDLVHMLAQYLDLEPLEKQALLERENLRQRAQSLVELLEMNRLTARMPDAPNVRH